MILKLLKKYGYTDIQAKKIISNPTLDRMSNEKLLHSIEEKYLFLKSLEYTDEQIIKMIVSYPTIYSYSIHNMKSKIEDMKSLGYDKKDILKMLLFFPNLFGYGMANMRQKIDDMESLGYTKKEILRMTTFSPVIYGYSTDNIKNKINDIESLGYTRGEVIKITVNLPSIFGYSTENIREKILYLREIGLEDVVVLDPKKIMQSVDLTYARYRYLTEELGLTLDMLNYRYLFEGEKSFVRKFKISKGELLEKYNYENEVRKNDNKTLIKN